VPADVAPVEAVGARRGRGPCWIRTRVVAPEAVQLQRRLEIGGRCGRGGGVMIGVRVGMRIRDPGAGYGDGRLPDRFVALVGLRGALLLRSVAGGVVRVVRGGAQLAIELGLAAREVRETVLVQVSVAAHRIWNYGIHPVRLNRCLLYPPQSS